MCVLDITLDGFGNENIGKKPLLSISTIPLYE
jgi:hypothetical protein